MTEVDVYFANGREVLNAYWGHLSGGGLRFSRTHSMGHLADGLPIALHIRIGSDRNFAVRGTVVQCTASKVVVTFDTSDAQSCLFAAALAEQDVDLEAQLRAAASTYDAVTTARLFEISEDGCCVRLNPAYRDTPGFFTEGTNVVIEAGDLRIEGVIVSARGDERYVIFSPADESAIEAVRAQMRQPALL